jgi:hypothetical protein
VLFRSVEGSGSLADLLALPAGELLAHDLHDLPLPRHNLPGVPEKRKDARLM